MISLKRKKIVTDKNVTIKPHELSLNLINLLNQTIYIQKVINSNFYTITYNTIEIDTSLPIINI